MLSGELGCRLKCIIVIANIVMLFEAGLDSMQNLDGLVDTRLDKVDLLKATGQRVILLEDATELRVSRRPNTANVPVCEHRLDEIRSIHDATGSGPCTDDRVYLVNK